MKLLDWSNISIKQFFITTVERCNYRNDIFLFKLLLRSRMNKSIG